MRAMILAAGRGERMGELTRNTPKPLLKINNRFLIEHAICYLRDAGWSNIVINVSYHAAQIQSALGDGSEYDVCIEYSFEPERLETGGGILQALPLLGDAPFLVMSSDIITDYPLHQLPKEPAGLAHVVMVDNPSFHPKGDFGVAKGYANQEASPSLTFANIGIYRPELFADAKPGRFPLNQLLIPAIAAKQVTAEHYMGRWYNVGTPDILSELQI